MTRATDREILRLAVPAFLALIAEPLFLLADAAIVGHLGTAQLAGLGIAGAVLQTVIGLCVFLAYGTTGSVARRLGAGDLRGAMAQGVDGLWLATALGCGGDRRGRAPGRPPGAPLRRLRPGQRPGGDLPADRLPRHRAAAAHARVDRRAPGSAGHPHPAGRRGRRQRPQRRPQPAPRLPGRTRHRRLRPRLGARPGGQRRRLRRRSWPGRRDDTAPRCAPTSPGSGPPVAPGSPW